MRTRRVLDAMLTLVLRVTLLASLVTLFVLWAGATFFDGPWCHPAFIGCVGLPTVEDVYETVMATLPR